MILKRGCKLGPGLAALKWGGAEIPLRTMLISQSIFCSVLHVKYFVNINNGRYSRHQPT